MMLDRYWQPFDTVNLLGAMVIAGVVFVMIVIWLADCASKTKQ